MAKYLPREELERRLRESYGSRDEAGTEFAAVCNRAAEIEIQMALWIHDEGARGTPPHDILQAIGQIMGLMIANAVGPWSGADKVKATAMLNGNLNEALRRATTEEALDYINMKAHG